jgi:hypothetical protein
MVINLSKCTFMVPELEVLGHIINRVGTTPIPQHIQVIIEYPPPPQDTKQLQGYKGMVDLYRRFTPGIAAVLEPLTTALKGGKKTLHGSPHLDAAFSKSKQVLTLATPPRPQQPWKITQLTFRKWQQSKKTVQRPRNSSLVPQL